MLIGLTSRIEVGPLDGWVPPHSPTHLGRHRSGGRRRWMRPFSRISRLANGTGTSGCVSHRFGTRSHRHDVGELNKSTTTFTLKITQVSSSRITARLLIGNKKIPHNHKDSCTWQITGFVNSGHLQLVVFSCELQLWGEHWTADVWDLMRVFNTREKQKAQGESRDQYLHKNQVKLWLKVLETPSKTCSHSRVHPEHTPQTAPCLKTSLFCW